MADRHAMILRAGTLFGALMERSSLQLRGAPVAMGLAAVAGATAANADNDNGNEDSAVTRLESVTSQTEPEKPGSMVKSIGEQLSVGGVLGFAAGYSIRKVGKAILFLVGTEVVILQYMAYREWLTMDWRRLGRDIAPRFSRSTWDGLVEILVYKMPFSAAFSGGLLAALKLSSSK